MHQSDINGYHVHVYFDHTSIDFAVSLTEQLHEKLGYQLGEVNQKPVGPHPVWSRQVSFKHHDYDAVMAWLEENRKQLSVLIHPLTENEYLDHTSSAVWLGPSLELDLSIFTNKQ